jgi:hypothetical protein
MLNPFLGFGFAAVRFFGAALFAFFPTLISE